MKKTAKKLLSMALVLVMVLSLLPATAMAAGTEGSSTKSAGFGAFGISTPSEMTSEEQAASENNPFGAKGENGAFPLLVKPELYVTYGWDGSDKDAGKNYVKSFDLTDDEGEAEFKVNYGAMVGYNENDLGASGNAYIAAAVDGFNPGSGKDEYVAMLGLNAQDKRLELSITDKNGQPVSVTINNTTYIEGNRSGEKLTWLTNDTEFYQMNGFLSVASGDFDGDGVDSIIMYEVGAGNSQVPSLREFNVTKTGDYLVISSSGDLVMGTDGMYKVLGGDVSNMSKTHPKNAPKVQMEAADTDKDGYDELVVTVSMNDTDGGESMKHLGTQVFIYDKLSSGWTLTARFSMKSTGVATDNSYANAQYRMVWGTSSVGNVIASDDSGVMTDFPEIVTVGMQDNESKDMHNINVDGNDKLVYSIIHCTGMTETDTGMKNYQGKYVAVKAGTLAANNFTKAGFYESEDVSPLLQTKCFSYKGAAEAEAVFISGSVYAWDANGGNGELTHLYTQRMFTMSAKMADGDKVSNMQVESVAAGNFDGNEDGREQVAAAFLLKKEGTGNGYIAMKTVGYYGAEDGDDTDAKNWYNGEGDSYFVKKKGNGYVALTDFDCDADSVIVEYEGVEKQWSDPNVMAILVASPYFHDIGLDNNSTTDYGVDTTSGVTEGESHTLTTNIVAGFEYTSIFETGGGFEATIENNFTWSTNSSRSITYTTNYSNTTEENQVVVYRSPVLVFKYKDVNTGEMIYLAKTLSPATSMISVEEYNAQAESCGMETIDESTLGIPGLPDTYPSTKEQIQTAFGLKDSDVLLADTTWANYSSNGLITKGITVETMKDSSFNYEFDFSFTAYGIIFGAKVGGGAGYGYETTSTVSDGTAIIRSGAVDGVGAGDYDFQWNFATWSTLINGLSIPVCGYLVKNVTAPPSPGMGLTAESITTDSVTLRWASGIRPAEQYRIYRVIENDIHVLVGAVQGDQTSFTLTGLKSNDAYTYVVRGVSYKTGKAVESVDSAPVTVRTQSENSKVRLTLFKQDGTSLPDDNILQSTGDDAGLRVQMTGISSSNRSYQWQLLEAGAEGIKNGWLSVNDLPKSMIGTVTGATGDTLTLTTIDESLNGSYLRCVVTVISTAGDLYTYYSPVAMLDLNGLDTTTTITVSSKNGSGSITDPYTGMADYAKITEVKTPIDVYVPATVKDSDGVEYTIYKDTEKNVYVGVHDEVDAAGNTSSRTYRVATVDGESYALGNLLTPSKDQYFKDSDSSKTYDTTQYAGFNGVSTVFETVGTVTYLKQYAVAESSLTEYWYNMTDGLYYTKSGNSFTKASSQPGSNADLRVVYYDNGSTVILSAVGEDNYDHYQVYTVANGSATAGDSFYRVPGTKIYNGEAEYADSANFEAVTVIEKGEYITYTSTPEPGDQLTLKAGVTDQNGTVDTQVTFTITNTDTGAVTQQTTTSGAEITWTAPRHGLYRIVATAAATTSTKSSSSECYYRADDPNNSYRLAVKQNGEQVTNISYNGGSVTLQLEKRTNGTWDAVSGVSYKVNNTDFAGSYTPNAAGTYIFSALVDGKTVATAVLVVNKVSITVTPTWTEAVPAYSDIELVATDAQGNDVTRLVNGYMTVSCDLYDESGSIKSDAASGVYTVTPAYVSSKMEEFLSRYSVTINTATIYYFSDRITVYFDAGENGEVYASYIDPSGTEFSFSDGSQISMDYGLKFVAEPDSGWSVNTWKVAVPSTDPSVSETDVTEYFSRYGSTLKIAEDDLKKLMEENGANTLTVSVTFTNQAHKITYSADDGGSLSATAGGGDLASDTSVAPNTTVTFTATPADGQMVEKWTVDGLDYKWDGTNALYRENTLTLKNIDSAHVVKVFFTGTDTTTVSVSAVDTAGVSYSGATVTVTDAEGNAIEDLTSVLQSNALTFTAKIGNTSSAMVKEWQTSTDGENWTTVSGSGQKNAITIYEHGASLYVRVVIAVAQTYTLNWEIEMEDGSDVPDEVKDSLTVCSGDADIENGAALAANVSVDFTLDLAEGYEVVDWDGADVNPDDNSKASISNLTSNTKVVVTIREKPTVTINFSVVDTNGEEKDGGTNGTLTAAVGAKSLSNGDPAYVQETVTFTAAPDTDYRVKEWRLNGDVQENTGNTFDLLLTEDMAEDGITVTVQFMPKGDKLMFYSEGNGSIQDVAVAGISYDFANGLTAAEDAEVVITAAPDTGYEVKAWKVDGVTQVGQTDNTFTYVATGDTGADITVVFQSVAYTVNWTAENGTVTAEGQTGSPAQIRGGETVTFTAEPDDGFVFDHWVVNGETVVGASNPFTWQVPEGEPTNTVHTVEAVFERENVQYTVTYSAVGSGTISAAGGEGGSVTVASGDSITFTATPATNYMVQEWQLDGTTIPGTANRLTYELTNVMGTHRVTVVFKAAVLYQVGYGVDGTDGTLTAKMNGNSLTLADGVTADVPAGSKLEFTATPATGETNYMVANWTVNGTLVTRDNMSQLGVTLEHYLSNTLTVESLSKNMNIQVSFTEYMGYPIPTDGPGYTVTGVERNPAVTYENAPADEVRKNGDLSFTISPDSANGYSTISSIKLGDTELLTDDPNDNITVAKNANGSYTVTITGVQSALDLTVTAHKLVITSGLDGYTPPAALVSQGLDTPEKIQTKLETKLTVSSDGKVFYDIALKYYDSETNGWVEVTEGNFPSSGVDVVLPYPDGTNIRDAFTIVHMLTVAKDGKQPGDLEVVSHTNKTDGLHFHVDSLSPFGVSWTKYTAPAGGGSGGGGGGGAASTETITIKSSVNGKVTADNTNAEEGDTVTLTVEPDKGYTLETLTVTDGSGKEVKLTEKDGKYTFTMPASKVTIKATFMEDNSMLNFFVDVPADAYYYDAVLWAAENGITGGVDDTHFAPNATCTRAQAVTFLWRAAGSPVPQSHAMPFTDVAEGSYYHDAVLWAVENGITKGTSDTTFTPNATCTRAQIVTFLWRSQKSPASDSVNPFTDVAADAYYANAVLWAVENGITGGTTATTFSPNNDCTRAQIVTFLYRRMK